MKHISNLFHPIFHFCSFSLLGRNRKEVQKRSLIPLWAIIGGFMQIVSFNASAQNWLPMGPSEFDMVSYSRADYTSIAVDGSDTPYVVYRDVANSYKATVRKYNGSSWETLGTAGFSSGHVKYPVIALDGNGTPYVAYQDLDFGNTSGATVMKYNGSNWELVGIAGFSGESANDISMAIDDSGTPYVAYSDYSLNGTNHKKATVMKYNGTSWVTVGTAGFSAGQVDHTSIAINSSGTPYVVYTDDVNYSQATVMKYNGSSWVNVGTAGFSTGSADYTSIAINGSGTPYVVYRDAAYSGKATVMKYNGSSWVNVGDAGFSTGGECQFYFYSDRRQWYTLCGV